MIYTSLLIARYYTTMCYFERLVYDRLPAMLAFSRVCCITIMTTYGMQLFDFDTHMVPTQLVGNQP